MYRRIVRLPAAEDVVDVVARRMLEKLAERQTRQERIDVCLTGGRTANQVYERIAELAVDADIDPTKIHLWWGDERFVPSTDDDRNSLQAVERLARTIPVNTAHIHMMAARDGRKDSHEAADEYATELGDTRFDLVLLGIGEDGHCASIFPDHPSFEPTNRLAIGVEDAPKPPSERISLTLPALNRADHVWFLATGEGKAQAVSRVLEDDQTLPASHVHGEKATLWFVDDDAASLLPAQHECEL